MCIVGALLENEGISGLSEGKPTGFRRQTSSAEMVWTPDDLIAIVSWTYHLYVTCLILLRKKLARVFVALCQESRVQCLHYRKNCNVN